MVNNYVLASVADVDIFNLNGDQVLNGNMLSDSNINFTASEQEVRGGYMNKLLLKYLTDSKLDFELNSVVFNLESLALNLGGAIEVGANCQTIETVECVKNGELVVSEEPQLFATFKTPIAWVSKVGENDWVKYDFDTVNTKKISISDIKVGDRFCVKYMKQDASAQELKISTAFMPQTVSALLKLPLMKVGANGVGSSTKVGIVEIEVPLAQFNGTSVSLSLSATGNATVPLSFTALDSGTSISCGDSEGLYAKVKQIIFDADEFDGVKNIVISDSDIDLAEGENQVVQVYALYGGLKAPKLLDNAKLTFTMESGKEGVATVGAHDGKVEAVGQGTATLEVIVTNRPTFIAKGVVEVTA